MPQKGPAVELESSIIYGNLSKQQSANDPSECCGDADPSNEEEQHAECRPERCANKIHDYKQRQDGSQFFRNADDSQRHYGDDDPHKPTEFLR